MAINLNHTIIEHKKHSVPLDPAVAYSTLERGQLMYISGYTDGRAHVAPTAGAAGEAVAGVLWLSETQQATATLLEEFTVPPAAPLELTLKHTPTAVAEMHAFDTDALTPITIVAGAPGAGQLGLTNNVLTADAALASANVTVVYQYTISAADLERRGGRRSINQGGEDLFRQCTLAYGQCEFTVSNFDTSEAWEDVSNVDVFAGANGDFALAGNVRVGSKVRAAHLRLTPGIEQAFVTVDCNLPGV